MLNTLRDSKWFLHIIGFYKSRDKRAIMCNNKSSRTIRARLVFSFAHHFARTFLTVKLRCLAHQIIPMWYILNKASHSCVRVFFTKHQLPFLCLFLRVPEHCFIYFHSVCSKKSSSYNIHIRTAAMEAAKNMTLARLIIICWILMIYLSKCNFVQ